MSMSVDRHDRIINNNNRGGHMHLLRGFGSLSLQMCQPRAGDSLEALIDRV